MHSAQLAGCLLVIRDCRKINRTFTIAALLIAPASDRLAISTVAQLLIGLEINDGREEDWARTILHCEHRFWIDQLIGFDPKRFTVHRSRW